MMHDNEVKKDTKGSFYLKGRGYSMAPGHDKPDLPMTITWNCSGSNDINLSIHTDDDGDITQRMDNGVLLTTGQVRALIKHLKEELDIFEKNKIV